MVNTENPIELTAIDHVVLRVENVDLMLGFYCDVLGCKVEKHQKELGLIQLRAGDSLIDLVTVDGELGRKGGKPATRYGHNVDHICLRVAHFEAEQITAHLRQHGLAPEPAAMRYGAKGHGLSIYVDDPEHNTIELKAPIQD